MSSHTTVDRKMRAAVLTGPREVAVQEVPVPVPGPGQVRVRLEGCGVCASNLPMWEGRPWFDYPTAPGAPGHEGWGVIDAVGPGAEELPPGTRVAMISGNAFADYDVTDASSVAPLPPQLEGDDFPGEPLGCAMNIFSRSDIRPEQTVAIIGAGFLGALMTRLCASAGARVLAISRRVFSLEVASGQGAEEAVLMDDHWRVIERVMELTGGRRCERVFEMVGLQWPLDLASALCAERGRLIIAGFHQDGPRQVNMQEWNWRGIDVVNAHERDPEVYVAGIEAAVEAVKVARLDPAPLLTHRFQLEQLGEAFEAMRCRPDGFVKGVVVS
jgi:threonine dehydrogenase-like Zn-dependent dehydrogenase